MEKKADKKTSEQSAWVIRRKDGLYFSNRKYWNFAALNRANLYSSLLLANTAIINLNKYYGDDGYEAVELRLEIVK